MFVEMSKPPYETNSVGVQYKIFVRTNSIIKTAIYLFTTNYNNNK